MSKVAPRSPPLKPVHGASWVQTIHAFWAGSPKGAATVAPLAILESAGSASDDETELKDGDAYEQATELLYEAQDDIISHDYAAALQKLERAARLGSSAACAYLANVYTHGLDCADHDHDDDVVAVDPIAAARWTIRGLHIELGKSIASPESSPVDMFSSDLSASGSASSVASEFGNFDLQAAADLATSLTQLFRTRRIRPETEDALDAKGKRVNMYEAGVRAARRMVHHDAIRSRPELLARTHDKLRKVVLINMHYLLAVALPPGDEETAKEEDGWQAVIEVGSTGDREVDNLVVKAQRRLALLQMQRREPEMSVTTTSRKPTHLRLPSPSRRARSPPRRRGSTFEVGGDTSEPTTPTSDQHANPLSPPASPSRSTRHRVTTSTPRLRKLTALYTCCSPTSAISAPTVALETDAHAFLPAAPLRNRAMSVVSLIAPLFRSSSSLARKTSSASLPDIANRSDRATAAGRFAPAKRTRVWVDELASSHDDGPSDAAASLRDVLDRHRAASGDDAVEDREAEAEAEEQQQTRTPSWAKASHRPALPKKASTLRQIRGLDARLASLEDASRVSVVTACAVCENKGVNFPRCPKCQRTFCSRSCRIGGGGDGAKHVCGKV